MASVNVKQDVINMASPVTEGGTVRISFTLNNKEVAFASGSVISSNRRVLGDRQVIGMPTTVTITVLQSGNEINTESQPLIVDPAYLLLDNGQVFAPVENHPSPDPSVTYEIPVPEASDEPYTLRVQLNPQDGPQDIQEYSFNVRTSEETPEGGEENGSGGIPFLPDPPGDRPGNGDNGDNGGSASLLQTAINNPGGAFVLALGGTIAISRVIGEATSIE